VQRVDEGKRLVEAAGATMDEIVASVQRVTQVMSNIADASREQLAGIDQVSGSVTQMDRVVQQNAALVAESAADAQHMSDQAEELMALVARFRIAAQAAAQAAAPVPAAEPARSTPTALAYASRGNPALAHNPIPSDPR
jgi:septal ring factor EnvC (AmiA/AmiB activator)